MDIKRAIAIGLGGLGRLTLVAIGGLSAGFCLGRHRAHHVQNGPVRRRNAAGNILAAHPSWPPPRQEPERL